MITTYIISLYATQSPVRHTDRRMAFFLQAEGLVLATEYAMVPLIAMSIGTAAAQCERRRNGRGHSGENGNTGGGSRQPFHGLPSLYTTPSRRTARQANTQAGAVLDAAFPLFKLFAIHRPAPLSGQPRVT